MLGGYADLVATNAELSLIAQILPIVPLPTVDLGDAIAFFVIPRSLNLTVE